MASGRRGGGGGSNSCQRKDAVPEKSQKGGTAQKPCTLTTRTWRDVEMLVKAVDPLVVPNVKLGLFIALCLKLTFSLKRPFI